MHSLTAIDHAASAGTSLATESAPAIQLGGGGGLILLAVLGWLLLVGGRGGRSDTRALARALRRGQGGGLGGFFKAIGAVLAVAWRFITGAPLDGKEPPPAPERPAAPVAQLGAIAVAPVGLEKREPGRVHRVVQRAVQRAIAWVDTRVFPKYPLGDKALKAVQRAGELARVTLPAWRGLGALLVATGRLLARRKYWPRTGIAAFRLGLTAVVLAWWLAPQTRAWVVLGLVLVVMTAVVAAITGPAGYGKWKGRVRGDDEIYGPSLWTAVRAALRLPETEYAQTWLHLPTNMAAADARVVLRLPWEYVAGMGERTAMDELLNQRIPGEWVSTWHLMGDEHYVQWTHKPKPKPKPECPDTVDFFDPLVQGAIEACQPGELVVGIDADRRPVVRKLGGDNPHWALSVGSGGGKSSTLQFLAVQLVRQRTTFLILDVKQASLKCFVGLDGFIHYADPRNIGDMRSAVAWLKEEVEARNYMALHHPETEFPKLVLKLEEGNEFGLASKRWWKKNKPKKAPETDPVWEDIASIMFMGRHVNVHVIGVFQDLRDQACGGIGLRGLFASFMLGKYKPQQFTMVTGMSSGPLSVNNAGRLILVEGNEQTWIQVPYAPEAAYRQYAADMRTIFGYDGGGLYGAPPTPSPEKVPTLIQALKGRLSQGRGGGAVPAPAGAPGGITAGGGRDSGGRDGSRDSGRDGSRDALGLIPGQTGHPAHEDPAEELLPLAEVARRLQAKGLQVKPGTMRQHKKRRGDFPKGAEVEGKELFTEAAILDYYSGKGKGA